MPIIDVKDLTKHYQVYKKTPGFGGTVKSLFRREYEEVKAVEGISFEISEGELIGFIGPNGAGKTTTLKMLSGLLHPTSGHIEVLGHTPYKRDHKYLKQIALLMGQKNQLWWDLPGMETFLLNKEIYDVSDTKFKETLDNLIELLDVKEFVHIPVKKLSLGQRMKMELIAALLHSPKVLFLDEPTIGLDVVMQKTLREFIREYNKRFNSTIILTSHYMKDVEALAKRVIVINHGKLLYDGPLTELVKKHAPFKLIKVTLTKEVTKKDLEKLGTVKEVEYPNAILQATKDKVDDVAAKILKTDLVEDFTIEDPDIEDVIREVFSTA